MKNILLVCSSGMSTNMLVQKMVKSAKLMNFDVNIWSVGDINVEENIDKADIILLGPQVRYLFDKIKKIAGENKTVLLIGLEDYSSMNGKNILSKCFSN